MDANKPDPQPRYTTWNQEDAARRFSQSFAAAGFTDEKSLRDIFAKLYAHYTAPERAYHNIGHIRHCLLSLEETHASPTPGMEIALWFHDVIYDAYAKDNEQQSADYAARALASLNAPAALTAEVTACIMATLHKPDASLTPMQQLTCDADLYNLGSPWEEFDGGTHAIRKEYSNIPDPEFYAGRARILQNFLSRPRIFQTPPFAHLEHQARANLQRSIQLLLEKANASTPNS